MSNIRIKFSKLRRSEQGMVAIMTTMVLMIVISMIVLGFAQISRRNQRESLDRQLSTQAFYAAESGVNDARKIIQDAVTAGQVVRDKDQCTGTGTAGFYAGLNPDIDASKNVKYTCLLVDPSPKKLTYSDIGTTAVVVPVISADSSAISTIKLDWQAKVTGSPLIGCPTSKNNVFSPTASWTCGYGVLRFDLVPTAGAFDADTLRNNTMTTFAVPSGSAGVNSIAYPAMPASTNNANNSMVVRCTATGCSLQVTGLSANNYHLRISSIYRDVALQLSATGAAGNTLEIAGAQALIDATGKAQDVLRRIQVSVPYRATTQNQLSDYAIEMNGSICKRYSVMNGYISNQANVPSSNRLCRPFTSP